MTKRYKLMENMFLPTPLRRVTALILVCLFLPGCSMLMRAATEDLAGNLSRAILKQNDPKTVRDGAPAYLLMVDSFIDGDPDSVSLLLAGAKLYGTYAGVFVDEADRARRLSSKAWSYARRAWCRHRTDSCSLHSLPYDSYSKVVAALEPADVPVAYNYAVTWAGYLQAHRDDMVSMANVPRVQQLLSRVVALAPDTDNGGAHMYLGVLKSLLPAALGGKPDEARAHFEQASKLAAGRNLMPQVLQAEHVARPLFLREEHDRLLQQVLAADPEQDGYTLMNVLAQQRARELQRSAAEYF